MKAEQSKTKMAISKTEKETVINFNEGETHASVYSCTRSVWKRCEKLGMEVIRVDKDRKGKIVSKEYQCPKNWIKIQRPRRVSEAQRKRSAEIMRTLHQNGKI